MSKQITGKNNIYRFDQSIQALVCKNNKTEINIPFKELMMIVAEVIRKRKIRDLEGKAAHIAEMEYQEILDKF